MSNYTFKPSYPLYHRSSQAFFFTGLILGISGIVLASSSQEESFIYIAFILTAFVSLFGFIFQNILLRDRRQRGLFFVIQMSGFHVYAGRGQDYKANWDEIEKFEVKKRRLHIIRTDNSSIQVNLTPYARIDRLRIESLMYQLFTYSTMVKEPHEELVPA